MTSHEISVQFPHGFPLKQPFISHCKSSNHWSMLIRNSGSLLGRDKMRRGRAWQSQCGSVRAHNWPLFEPLPLRHPPTSGISLQDSEIAMENLLYQFQLEFCCEAFLEYKCTSRLPLAGVSVDEYCHDIVLKLYVCYQFLNQRQSAAWSLKHTFTWLDNAINLLDLTTHHDDIG